MGNNIDVQYGIKYRVIKLDKTRYILFPISLEKGQETEEGFETERGTIIPYAFDLGVIKNRYVMDMIFEKDELEFVYDYEDSGDGFLGEVFFNDYKDTIYIVDTDESKGYRTRNSINLRVINEEGKDITYVMDKSIPAIVLNEKALDEIAECEDLDEVKLLLMKYKQLIASFKDYNKQQGVTKISVVNGRVESVETSKKVDQEDPIRVYSKDVKKASDLLPTTEKREGDVSYQGLRDYLKERVFGHDEEIETIAQKLYMNYTAEGNDPVESILLVGPTGTGKTETVRAACSYLDIPSFETNASNLVPQGIKGMSIEDVIIGLYERAGHDLAKAQRGLVFLDEFDKLNDSDVDIKNAVKNILLTFTGGGTFPIDNDRYTFSFDSSKTNKMYAGVFDKINERTKQLGFGMQVPTMETLGTEEEIRQKIIDKGYFSPEELTRISTVLGYSDLDRETKKRILLESKLSEFRKKQERYKRQFGIDLIADETYIEAILDSISKESTGMRSINNYVKRTLNLAERKLLENSGYKRLVLTRDTVEDPTKFDLS